MPAEHALELAARGRCGRVPRLLGENLEQVLVAFEHLELRLGDPEPLEGGQEIVLLLQRRRQRSCQRGVPAL
jgi:hypothetical protein